MAPVVALYTQANFYPRSPCGERHAISCFLTRWNLFLSTLSLRRATGYAGVIHHNKPRFLSTLSLRRATYPRSASSTSRRISIHALLAESDRQKLYAQRILFNFYPRSPCGERQLTVESKSDLTLISIHALLAESDHRSRAVGDRGPDFYPRSPCGERLPGGIKPSPRSIISIHALLAESDGRRPEAPLHHPIFLSTLSLRRATF